MIDLVKVLGIWWGDTGSLNYSADEADEVGEYGGEPKVVENFDVFERLEVGFENGETKKLAEEKCIEVMGGEWAEGVRGEPETVEGDEPVG